jgi:signal transduction histidine kinase
MTQAKHLNPQSDALLQRIDELEGRLSSARAEMETSTQLQTLGLLAGAIAHEFNNILTPVLSYARAALDDPADTELGHKALQKAADGVERASQIATSVLNLAHRAGDNSGDPPRCSPEPALLGAISCLDQPLEALGIEMRTAFEAGVSLPIHQTDLEHVLLNLLLNACRALGNGGGVIEVSCCVGDAASCSTWNTDWVSTSAAVLMFRDNGPGIGRDLLPTLFEPFQKGNTGRGSRASGHGLGLAICRRFVEAAGGTITAQPSPDGGAAFTITLPLGDIATHRAA